MSAVVPFVGRPTTADPARISNRTAEIITAETVQALDRLERRDDASSWDKASIYIAAYEELREQPDFTSLRGQKLSRGINAALRDEARAADLSIAPPSFLSDARELADTWPDIFRVDPKDSVLSFDHYRRLATCKLPRRERDRLRKWAEAEHPSQSDLRRCIRLEVDARQSRDGISPMIRPSESWNFATLSYPRLDAEGEHGYIPGDIYANCLWYWTRPGNVVVAPMAGSGQIMRVYEDRARGMQPEPWELDLYLFDLTPRGHYAALIRQNDLTRSLPVAHADYIVIDVPYLRIAHGQYSDRGDDLANKDAPEWAEAITTIASVCRSAQRAGDLCTIIATNYREPGNIVLATKIVRDAFTRAGYRLHDIAYASRRIQQTQTPTMARANIAAKRSRTMLSEIAEVQTFAANGDSTP
jgi:hypothetical protein